MELSRGERKSKTYLHHHLLWFGVVCMLCMLGTLGCRDLSDPSLPAGTQSPDTYLSRTGGLMLAKTAEQLFKGEWIDMTIKSGLLTDELTSGKTSGAVDVLDHRLLANDGMSSLYAGLHKIRGQARLARSVLAAYAPDLSPAIRGRLYAFEAYAEVWLADMYCSGVPLSTIDFQGDYTDLPPSTTDEVYAHAVTLFDSALALAADSAAVQTLARVGKGRALLAMAQYDAAEAAVSTVQSNDTYQTLLAFARENPNNTPNNLFAYSGATVSDREGINGLPFRSSGDPRTVSPLAILPNGSSSVSAFFPSKYSPTDSTLVVIAGSIDAQLIKAEAALQRKDRGTWLSILNTLRTTGTYTRIDTAYTDTTKTTIRSIDTVWQAGSGGYAGLRPLLDPGSDTARLRILFAERAAWLFMSGQRQGDLRRLVRQYGLVSDDVYPTGVYTGLTNTGYYGSDIDLPIPEKERRNPLFKGCLHRD